MLAQKKNENGIHESDKTGTALDLDTQFTFWPIHVLHLAIQHENTRNEV